MMNSNRKIIGLKRHSLSFLVILMLSIFDAKGQATAREEFLRKIQNSTFTAVVQVKDGKRRIKDVIVGDIQKFKFLENGQLSNPDKDRIYLIILDSEKGDSERIILTVHKGVIRFGITKSDTETVANLITRFQYSNHSHPM